MSDEVPQSRATLQDWEDWLAPQVRAVELLGEIPISAEECQQLGKVIGLRLHSLGLTDSAIAIKNRYACAFATYLVAQGVFGYRGGDYWSEVCQTTRLKPGNTSRWGQLFEEILESLRLPLFPDLGGRRYVDLILMHGGIPDYCLEDFFNNMLRPALTRDVYAGMSVQELMDEWLLRSSGRSITDKPVLRFLEFGGRVAEDFVERCRELAGEFLVSGLVPQAQEAGLPRRVVEAFHTWAVEKDGFGLSRREEDEASGLRLRRPEILLNPWGEGITLNLPPQQIPATLSQARIAWHVKAGARVLEVPVRIRRAGYDLRTSVASLALEAPAEAYEVSLWVDGQPQRTWRYPGPDTRQPLLVFEPGRGALLRRAPSLPACPLWLLYPRQAELDIVGEAALLEEFPRLPWGWADFQGGAWDLSRATSLTLRWGDTTFTSSVRPDEASRRPFLAGGELFAAAAGDETAVPLYVGAPPAVRVPLAGRTGLAEELARWRLSLRSQWAACPRIEISRSLADLRPYLVERDGEVELPLSAAPLLGDRPYGNFVVRLRGPLGRDAELPLRILPRLTVAGHEKLYLPDPQTGPPPVTLLIETGAGDSLECQTEGGACQVQLLADEGPAGIQRPGQCYQVLADAEASAVTLIVARLAPDGELVRVPARIPLYRLRWALVGEGSETQGREWTGRVIKRPLDALVQAESPSLLIDLGVVGTLPGREDDLPGAQPAVTLRLVDTDGVELQRQPMAVSRTGARRGIWRFDLVAFLDTVRHSPSPVVRFELECCGLPEGDELVRLPVLSLARAMLVEDVKMEHKWLDKERIAVRLTWREPVRLHHRRVRFWPLWRPWLPVYEQPIPDTAEGTLEFQVPVEQLPPLKYRLEFLVADPWAVPSVPQRPPVDAPGTATLEMVNPAERLGQIERLMQRLGPRFTLLLERATIRTQAGQADGAQADLSQCYARLDEADIPQVLALGDLVQQRGDQGMLTRLQLKMFAAERVQQLLDARAAGKLDPAHFQTFLAYLPRSSLLPAAACEKLLAVEDETVQLYAIQQLIRRGLPHGVEAVLTRMRSATLSDADASILLKLNADFAVSYLERRADDPLASRLLAILARELGDRVPIVRVGGWVRSPAGWGRIEKIEELASGRPVEQFVKGRAGFRLTIILRPLHDAELVTIEVLEDRCRLQFERAQKVHRCTQAEGCCFITSDVNLLRGDHNRAAHGGLSPQFAIERKTHFLSVQPLEYSARAPRNMLA
jgi:hypothetical protein